MKARCLFSLIVALLSLPALAGEPLVGTASVIDGDTIEIHGQRIRLHGIDAPESRQECTRPDGATWRCGQQAALALSDRIGRSVVHCDARGRDRYDRIIAICFKGTEDLNRWMVASGCPAPGDGVTGRLENCTGPPNEPVPSQNSQKPGKHSVSSATAMPSPACSRFCPPSASLLSFRFRNRLTLELELVALRHQVTVLRRQRPGRPRLGK